jgi:trimethylamine---corrinoid protein Co-methyltransferase
VGYLDGGMTNSIEQVVICDELIAYTKHFMRSLEINEETLALDLIDQIGPDGDFLSSEHTLEHYREDWYPKLFDRSQYDIWKRKGGKTLRERARDKALKLIETHRPEPLPAEVQKKVDAIVEQYA